MIDDVRVCCRRVRGRLEGPDGERESDASAFHTFRNRFLRASYTPLTGPGVALSIEDRSQSPHRWREPRCASAARARARRRSGRRRAGSCALRASRSFYTCRSSFYCDCLRGRRGRVTVGDAVGYAAWRPRRPAPGACVYTMRMRLGRLVASDHTVSRTGAVFPPPGRVCRLALHAWRDARWARSRLDPGGAEG